MSYVKDEAARATARAQAGADYAAGIRISAYTLSQQGDAYAAAYHARMRELREQAPAGGGPVPDPRREPRRVTVYEPVSMIAAEPGWRAVFTLNGIEPGEPGQGVRPLIGWGIYHVTERPAAGETGPTHNCGQQVHGIVATGAVAVPALQAGEFRAYLAPGEPMPREPRCDDDAEEAGDAL
jgi:hypothetical protein